MVSTIVGKGVDENGSRHPAPEAAGENRIKIGSLFSGYGGLDLALRNVTGGRTVWVSDIDENANTILEARFPGVPNLGDIAEIEWSEVEPVDVLCGGFPCFIAGTKILTEKGDRPIEDITVGTVVYTHRNRWREVTSTMSRLTEEVVDVTIAGGKHPIVTTREHPFYIRETETSETSQWVAAGDLKPGMFTARPAVTGIDNSASPTREPFSGEFFAEGFTWVRVLRIASRKFHTRVYNVSVEEDESYVADNTVVHNCQDLSTAGKRAGLRPGTRSGLWEHMAYSINALKPRMVVIENVRGIFSASAHSSVEFCEMCMGDGTEVNMRALGAVLADLAELGYDARWCGVRAAEAGAPHGRFRVFIVAYPKGTNPSELYRNFQEAEEETPPDAEGTARGTAKPEHLCSPAETTPKFGERSRAAAHSDSVRHPRRESCAEDDNCGDGAGGLQGGGVEPPVRIGHHPRLADEGTLPRVADGGDTQPGFVSGTTLTDFGPYAPALLEWENILGRPAPEPTEDGGTGGRQRLNPRFVEFMMVLPEGWVTGVPIGRNAHLKALGNGVVPQQATLALTILLGYGDE